MDCGKESRPRIPIICKIFKHPGLWEETARDPETPEIVWIPIKDVGWEYPDQPDVAGQLSRIMSLIAQTGFVLTTTPFPVQARCFLKKEIVRSQAILACFSS